MKAAPAHVTVGCLIVFGPLGHFYYIEKCIIYPIYGLAGAVFNLFLRRRNFVRR